MLRKSRPKTLLKEQESPGFWNRVIHSRSDRAASGRRSRGRVPVRRDEHVCLELSSIPSHVPHRPVRTRRRGECACRQMMSIPIASWSSSPIASRFPSPACLVDARELAIVAEIMTQAATCVRLD